MKPALLIFVLTVAAFARLTTCDFTLWDDPDTLKQNRYLNPPTAAAVGHYWMTAGDAAPMGLYVPVTYTAWAIVSAPTGRPTPVAVHALNVLLHAATAAAVFLLLRRFFDAWPAAVGALVFAVHPVQVEAVGWASGTKDVLCGFFVVTSLIAHTRGRRWLGLLLMVMGVLSKPTAVVAPVMAAVIDRWLIGRSWREVIRSLWPWFVAAVPLAIVARVSQQMAWTPGLPWWTRPIVAVDAIGFYLRQLAWPAKLCFDYGRRPGVVIDGRKWIATTGIVVGVFLLCRLRLSGSDRSLSHKRRWAVVGLFLAPLLPVLGLLPFEMQYFSTTADHYLYLPMLGVAVAVACLCRLRLSDRSHPLSRKRQYVIGLLSIALTVRSILQQGTWRSTTTLAKEAIAVNPATFAAHDLLGVNAFTRALAIGRGPAADREFDEAITQFKAVDRANPQYTSSLLQLVSVYRLTGRNAKALAAVERLIAIDATLEPGMRMNARELNAIRADCLEAVRNAKQESRARSVPAE